MDLTWIVTLKIASTALTYITQARRGPALQRKEACKHIMSTAMAEMEATGLREALDQAKKDLHRRWSVMNLAAAKTMSDDERESRRLGVYKMIEESDFADGEPNSVLRLRQVSYLYNLNLPTLHIHISSAPDQTAKWFEWACGLPSGKSYYMSALASKEPIERLLRQFAPPDAKDDSWMQNPGQRALALDAAGARLKAGLSSDHFSSANQRNRVLQRWKGSTLDTTAKDSLNGEKISMQAGGAFLLYWLRGGQTVRIEFRAPRSLVPKTKEDERFIFL